MVGGWAYIPVFVIECFTIWLLSRQFSISAKTSTNSVNKSSNLYFSEGGKSEVSNLTGGTGTVLTAAGSFPFSVTNIFCNGVIYSSFIPLYILTGLGLICRRTSFLDVTLCCCCLITKHTQWLNNSNILKQSRTLMKGLINPAESPKLPFTLQGINWIVWPAISMMYITAIQSV